MPTVSSKFLPVTVTVFSWEKEVVATEIVAPVLPVAVVAFFVTAATELVGTVMASASTATINGKALWNMA